VRSHQNFYWMQACISSRWVINVIRIMTATEPKRITITVDGELSGEYVGAVETFATQAIAQRRPTQLFLRDVSAVDESGRALLARLATKGVRLRAAGVYCSHIVAGIS
jgi:ABC-type transporter Mla MlaB component